MQKRHLTEFNTSLIKTIIKLGVKGHFLTLNSIHENPIASIILGASQVALEVKNLSADAGDLRDASSIPESGRSPGEGNGNPLHYSCLENPMDRGALCVTVHHKESETTWNISPSFLSSGFLLTF